MRELQELADRYQVAASDLTARRNSSWCSIDTEFICGIEVLPLTLQASVDLEIANNPFLCEGIPDAADALVYIWRNSIHYKPTSKWWGARRNLTKALAKKSFVDVADGIKAHINSAFEDDPANAKGSGGANKFNYSNIATAHWAAVYVNILASEYGWSIEYILNLSFKRVYQLIRCINERHNPDYKPVSPLRELDQEYLEILNNRNNGSG